MKLTMKCNYNVSHVNASMSVVMHFVNVKSYDRDKDFISVFVKSCE